MCYTTHNYSNYYTVYSCTGLYTIVGDILYTVLIIL